MKLKNIFPHGKKGFNDAYLTAIIILIFFGVGLIIPFVNQEFGTTSGTFNTGAVGDQLINQDLQDSTSISAFDLLKSIGKMFFWTFGDIPFWLDAIFLVLRILLVFILIKNFTPFLGGG